MAKIRYYHASPYRIRVGTELRPGLKAKNYDFSGEFVYMTTSPKPHDTVMLQAQEQGWHVYEVRPVGELSMGSWGDVRAPRAIITRYVGTARGIARSMPAGKDPLARSLGLKDQGFLHKAGSFVDPRSLPRKTRGRGCYARVKKEQEVIAPSVATVRQMMREEQISRKERSALYAKLGIKQPTWLREEV